MERKSGVSGLMETQPARMAATSPPGSRSDSGRSAAKTFAPTGAHPKAIRPSSPSAPGSPSSSLKRLV